MSLNHKPFEKSLRRNRYCNINPWVHSLSLLSTTQPDNSFSPRFHKSTSSYNHKPFKKSLRWIRYCNINLWVHNLSNPHLTTALTHSLAPICSRNSGLVPNLGSATSSGDGCPIIYIHVWSLQGISRSHHCYVPTSSSHRCRAQTLRDHAAWYLIAPMMGIHALRLTLLFKSVVLWPLQMILHSVFLDTVWHWWKVSTYGTWSISLKLCTIII